MGFYTLILLAGLQAIPAQLYEAGSIDGTSNWQSFRFITLPLLMPTMFVRARALADPAPFRFSTRSSC